MSAAPQEIEKPFSLDDYMREQELKRQLPARVTMDDYTKAVTSLIELARKDCGGSRAAVQVILSLYNGNNWQVNLVDLCNLDADYFRDCLTAIRGRWEFNREPHELIQDGDRIFGQLQDEWKHLHIKNRYKSK